ncbi:MAG: response regulator [Chitinophagaceae bacterium]|nr:response regulator [Chitinophagaceae bacterium]
MSKIFSVFPIPGSNSLNASESNDHKIFCGRYYSFMLIVFLSLLYLPGFSQKQDINFSHLTVRDGLSQSDVQSIVRDKYGFMWFATEDGLNRYDGYKFTLFKHNPNDPSSLSSNIINALYEDLNGDLWIGTTGGGLSKYNRNSNSFSHFLADPADPFSITNNSVACIYEDRRGNLWVGTYQNLNLFNRKTKKFTSFLHNAMDTASISNEAVFSMLEDTQGNLWIGTERGLNLFDPASKKFKRYVTNSGNPAGIRGNHVRAIMEDNKGNLWIGTDESLELFDRKTGIFTHFQQNRKLQTRANIIDNNIFALADGGNGNIWIGTEKGLDLFHISSKTFTHYQNNSTNPNSISNNSVNSLLLDATGILWVGTYAGGVNKYDKNLSQFAHYKKDNNSQNGLSHNIVTAFAENEQGDIWIGTDGGGLNLLDKKRNRFTVYQHRTTSHNSLSNNSVLELLIDREKNLWIGTYEGGLDHFDTKTNKFTNYKKGNGAGGLSSNSVFALLEDRRGNIWIGTNEGGLNVLNKTSHTITRYRSNQDDQDHSLVNDDIRYMLEDREGMIWIGTYGGLSHFNPLTGKFTNYSNIDSNLTGQTVFSIYEDRKGNIWVGTMGALNLFNKATKRFAAFTEQNGLANNTIKYITEDNEGNLWLSTNRGISRFDPKTKKVYNYDMDHGLQGYEFFHGAGLKLKNGEILFGGINGFNRFHPSSMNENEVIPRIAITDFQLFNNPVIIGDKNSPLRQHISETKEIVLSYDQSVFTVEYTALNYTVPEKNRYAFMLEGFDKKWNYVQGQRKATYTNLDPGQYIFRVKAANNDGVWNEVGASLKIIIKPPFWKTWWFKMLSVTILFGGIFIFIRIRINNINAAKARLERLVTERTESLALMTEEERNARKEAEQANRAKSIFLATMSHEIRTPMNGVIGTASLLAETALNTEQRRYAEIIRTSGENLLSVINDILDFSKIESGKMELEQLPFDIRLCIEEILDLFAGKAAESKVDLVYEMGSNVPENIVGDGTRLRQILINLVGNALKFTHEGEVFIGVKLIDIKGIDCKLSFEIRDTGIGIPADKMDRLFKAFTQVDSSTTRKYGGSGLGLAICKRLVELMGGKIDVQSTVGQGATFRFTVMTSQAKMTVRSHVQCNANELQGKKILIVDDNETNRYILHNQLQQWKLVPVVAGSGKEALRLLSINKDFDLVVTDMQMPEMNGIELAKSIKDQYPQLPLFLLSSVGDERGKQYETLFSTILTKPVKQQQLCKAMVMQFKQGVIGVSENHEISRQRLSVNFAAQYPMKILVAEDNPVNQLLAVMVLRKLGYEPDTAINGVKALEAVMERPYDLILMDVQMPEMDGLEATRLIRDKLKIQPVIIAATANAMHEDREICLGAGMDDYISKPLELESLVNMIEKWAHERQLKSAQFAQ